MKPKTGGIAGEIAGDFWRETFRRSGPWPLMRRIVARYTGTVRATLEEYFPAATRKNFFRRKGVALY